MSNGKGDKPRHKLKKYAQNYDQINWGKKNLNNKIANPNTFGSTPLSREEWIERGENETWNKEIINLRKSAGESDYERRK